MRMVLIGWALVVVLMVVGVRALVQRYKLQTGHLQRCPHCDRPYADTPVYCPHCGEVLQHGSFRR